MRLHLSYESHTPTRLASALDRWLARSADVEPVGMRCCVSSTHLPAEFREGGALNALASIVRKAYTIRGCVLKRSVAGQVRRCGAGRHALLCEFNSPAGRVPRRWCPECACIYRTKAIPLHDSRPH